MKSGKNVPFKNYIFLSVILIISIILVIYFYMWYSEIEETKFNAPIMDDYLTVINYNEINDYLVENNNVIIYVSVLNNVETRNFEKKFKKIVDDYSLGNVLLYLNLTSENNKVIRDFMNEYNIASLPYVINFKNGKVASLYNISENNYDIELLVNYLRIEGIVND